MAAGGSGIPRRLAVATAPMAAAAAGGNGGGRLWQATVAALRKEGAPAQAVAARDPGGMLAAPFVFYLSVSFPSGAGKSGLGKGWGTVSGWC